MFPWPHLNMRGSWENSRQLCKPEMRSRVCTTVEHSLNSLFFLHEAIYGNTEKVLYYFYKIFFKVDLTNEEKCWGFFYFLIETDFLDSRSYFYFLPANQNVCLTIDHRSIY